MAAERNFFHRWRGMTTIGYELGVIWEMSDNLGGDMAIPDFQSIFRPMLEIGATKPEWNINDCIDELAVHFDLTEGELEEMQPRGHKTVFANRAHWARTYLDKAGALVKTRRSHFSVTDRGKVLLEQNPHRVDNKVLKQFSEFVEFQRPKSKATSGDGVSLSDTDDLEIATPEERIEAAEEEINNKLRSDLLDSIQEGSPAFFERIVIDLIVGMGYGGSRESTAKRIGKSGDEGVDGIVDEDPLGLDVIYLQAKRYATGNNIGREKIQQFAGALVGQGANKGVFVTTSAFTQGAIEYAQKIPQRLILIDGDELARLMVQYDIGVRTERSVEIRKLDLDYFGSED